MNIRSLFLSLLSVFCAALCLAQSVITPKSPRLFETPTDRAKIYSITTTRDSAAVNEPELAEDTQLYIWPEYEDVTYMPLNYFRPVVFDKFHFLDSLSLINPNTVDPVEETEVYGWINDNLFQSSLIRQARQAFIVNNPDAVLYNEATLPEPPRKFIASIDPETAKIVMAEAPSTVAPKHELEVKFEKRHWLKKFSGTVQFSQAYVSPNWYQGGNNNLNVLINGFYNVKLNPAYHPKWLFETTVQYKLGMNNAPDDSLRNYSISEDLFQFNMLTGFKANKHWYYSTNVAFKTQFLNNYKSNTHDLKAAFLSPGELNVGVGMTYNIVNPKKTFTFDASISPFSWNMKTCINHRMDETAYGIKPGRKTVSEIGSSGEGKLYWQICDNISLRSRLFVFTDYEYVQSDWENTLSFAINRFLTTQILVHMRYDSSTPRAEDSEWHKFQLKEILSFGFAYSFSSI